MSTITTPTLVNVNHWVEPSLLIKHGVHEDAYLRFETEWRGEPAVIEMRAHRNESYWSDRLNMGEWNITGKDSWLGTSDSKLGETTPTAQLRMGDQVRPLVEAWLASPAYTESESRAYAHGIKGLMREFRSRCTDSFQVRRLLAQYRNKLTDHQATVLTELFDAWDTYVRLDDLARFPEPTTSICRHCSRRIVLDGDVWVDPEATGDDSVWRETCDAHDTFIAEHEPETP